MADLDRLAKEFGDPVPLERVAQLVAELDDRRDRAARELRFTQGLIAEIGSLKRRLTALRRSCRLRSSVGNTTVRAVLREDDARRRRFEKKQRGRRA